MLVLDCVYYTFIAVVCFQVVYYVFVLGKFSFYKEKQKTYKNLPISVIICAKNEAENLKSFLPSIIEQDYKHFEIVLINDASSDDTLEVMEQFSENQSHIKIVNVKNNEAFWANKKYALTLGIKASKYNHLLFTDADCMPLSKNWISEMSAQFDTDKSIVLSYGAYSKNKNSVLNKLIRFETMLTAMHYFSFAKLGLPYMGVGRNLAYTKQDFFNANGFMKHMHVRSGDDDLFINEIANTKNTAISTTKESFTISVPKNTFKEWVKQKKRHITTAKYYKPQHKIPLTLFYTTQLLFWILALVLLVTLFHWKIVLSLLIIRFIIQFVIFWFSAKKLNELDVLVYLPLLECFLIVFQLTIFISNLISKPKHWK